ncbi:LOW QUALITY PROTEIN: hypothetical protein CVT25_013796 [Psilocybe cyanescens]|uniref:Uncharacterized protein n=1 Tax=Psilocybe cyanescens TaxID=93625 RepID=A0A409X1W4_PSICY|nr:LOW QUALITY PROTEIN: hypothetical protein CVT25_013796 [Psilocybe cyanescens]
MPSFESNYQSSLSIFHTVLDHRGDQERSKGHVSDDISVRDFAENVWGLGAEKCRVILDVSFQLREDTLARYRQVLNVESYAKALESELQASSVIPWCISRLSNAISTRIKSGASFTTISTDRPAPSKNHGRHTPIPPRLRPHRPQHWAPAPVRLRLWVPSPPRRGMRPVSSVVGFSIPAAALTAGAAMAAMGATLKVRPRGLAGEQREHVLRALGAAGDGALPAVSPAFGGAWAGGDGWVDGERAGGGKEKEKGRETLLVDATIKFLREFVYDKKVAKAVNGNGKANGNTLASASAVASGSGSGNGFGKGERERDEDDWDGELFLPTGIHDAMKTKKRFDGRTPRRRGRVLWALPRYIGRRIARAAAYCQPPASSSRQINSVDAGAGVEEREEAAPPEEDG